MSRTFIKAALKMWTRDVLLRTYAWFLLWTFNEVKCDRIEIVNCWWWWSKNEQELDENTSGLGMVARKSPRWAKRDPQFKQVSIKLSPLSTMYWWTQNDYVWKSRVTRPVLTINYVSTESLLGHKQEPTANQLLRSISCVPPIYPRCGSQTLKSQQSKSFKIPTHIKTSSSSNPHNGQ